MTLIKYVPKKFAPASRAIIDQAAVIMAEFEAQGFKLTLRQLYYQFVSRGLIENTLRSYKNLGEKVNDGRLAGLLSWSMIEDRGRNYRHNVWLTADEMIVDAKAWYRQNLWRPQPVIPEVWIEKDALVGVIEPICDEYRAGYIACRGYLSQSEAWAAAMRISSRYQRTGQKTVVLHLGDHDPSGIDMTRDNLDRLRLFVNHHCDEGDDDSQDVVEVRRLALNRDQVRKYKPPPNPAKITDSRAADYIAKHGRSSWELDALTPQVIADLIQENFDMILDDGDRDAWDAAKAEEEKQIARLDDAAEWLRENGED